jgi:secreted trypsin-like serine protease
MFRKASVLLILGFLLALTVLPAAAITWGEPDTDNHYANVGAMVVDWPDYGPYQWCSGTLIHPRVFLTAGHCTDPLAEYGIERVWVSFEPYALDNLLEVEAVLTHPQYAWESNNFHDVGLLILAEPVDYIEPARLPEVGYLDDLKAFGVLRQKTEGAKFTMVGYGGTLEWPPPDITYDDYRQVSISEYVALVPYQLHLNQHIYRENGGTCFGDSGGPAFYTESDGTEVIVGITSWGDAQCVVTGFNYRVDIPDTLDFIASAIDGLEE